MHVQGQIQDFWMVIQSSWGGGCRFVQFDQFFLKFPMKMKWFRLKMGFIWTRRTPSWSATDVYLLEIINLCWVVPTNFHCDHKNWKSSNIQKNCWNDHKIWTTRLYHTLGRVKRIWYLSPMRAAKVQASLRICAVSPEPPLLAHTSSESRGTFRQKARSLGPLNGWECAVKICHDGMLKDTNLLDRAQFMRPKDADTDRMANGLDSDHTASPGNPG